ncbi:hypothetical protein [Streptomyces sp. NPDC059863]|uniref:hypothetical protein n=1 Tax=unclassified Streptomyces TaxID=2593676 RepID=UPI00364B402A
MLLREEIERRELRAYASGWRDAAEEYESALEQARATARSGRLRLVGRTPGQAAVIPFPQEAPQEAPQGDAQEDPVRDHPGVRDGGEPAPMADPRTDPRADPRTAEPRPPTEPVKPAFVRKRRSSKVPTIPTLTPPRRTRRDRGRPPGDDLLP